MISRIIKDGVCVIHRSRRLRWITQTEALIILDIMRKPNSIIVLLCIQSTKFCNCLHFKSTQCWRVLSKLPTVQGGLGLTACHNTLFWNEVPK